MGDPAWRWWLGPATVAVAFFAVTLAATLVGAALGFDAVTDASRDFPQWTGLLQDVIWIAVAIGVPLLVVRHARPSQFGLRRPEVPRAVVVLFAALVAFYAFSALYAAAAGLSDDANERLQTTAFGESVLSDLGYVALFAVVAPVAEELLFRGVLFAALGRAIGTWPAAITSGTFFGAIHLGGGQDAYIPVLITLGVILALAYAYSGTLYVAIAAHAVNNALATGSAGDLAADWLTGLLVASPFIAVLLAWSLSRAIEAWLPQRRPMRHDGASRGPDASLA